MSEKTAMLDFSKILMLCIKCGERVRLSDIKIKGGLMRCPRCGNQPSS